MNEVAQVDHDIGFVTGTSLDGHVERPLAEERLTVWRHVTQVVNYNEYLDDALVWIEQRLRTNKFDNNSSNRLSLPSSTHTPH